MSKPSSRRRWLSVFCMLGVASLAVSLAGSAWTLRPSNGANAAPTPPASDRPLPAAVGIGHVDVEGGVVFPYPTTPGRVVEVLVKEGQAVKKGDLLFRLDDFLAKKDLESAKRAVRLAESQLTEAKNARPLHQLLVAQQAQAITAKKREIEAARLKAERVRASAGITPGVNAKDAEAAEKGVEALEASLPIEEKKLEALTLRARDLDEKIAQAELDLEQKKSLVEKAEYALSLQQVKAEMDGTVLRLSLQPGDLLAAQPKSPPVIFCPATPRIVRTEVEQEWAGRVELGQIATLEDYTSNGNGQKWTGKVTRVADWMAHRRSILPDPGQFFDVRTLECIVSLDPGQPPLRIGQRVRVTLTNP